MFQGGALSSLLLKFWGCLELCLYGNLVKEGAFLKTTKATSNTPEIGLDEKDSRTQFLKIGRKKMWVNVRISMTVVIFSTF